MTLQFHTWDKFKLLSTMTKQQITNFANLYSHLLSNRSMALTVLKVTAPLCLVPLVKAELNNFIHQTEH